MKKTIRNAKIDASIFTQEYWRERFNDLLPEFQGKRLISCLIEVDAKFDSIAWYDRVENVKKGKASLAITQAVCEAMSDYTDGKNKAMKTMDKIMKRQNLVA
jgi:hypothetical protein